ncbi:MAG TPA: helix-turn-helix domain-containing protein [Thermoanaerobaculia bacterium]|nr:helix-turn-helix domain-containing protein [Thermoanaerobaculia bacterium]
MVTLDQGGRLRRRIELVAAPADLAALVEHAWIQRERSSPAGGAAVFRVVPDCSGTLIFALEDEERAVTVRAIVVGARSTFADVDVSRRRLTLGVRLRPGALAALAGEPAWVFTDRVHTVDEVFGSPAGAVAELVGDSDLPAALVALFTFLRARASYRRPGLRLPSVAGQTTSVAELARALDLAPRTLYDRTRDEIGIGPKRLLRVLRLHHALETCRQSPGWADVAARAGFADQPHLTREIHALLGETPTAWLARGRDEASADPFKTRGAAPV